MRTAYRGIVALLAALLGLAGVLLTTAPARAADVFVEVNPSTAQAGTMVGIRASCSENSTPATVESPAFGTVTVQPQAGLLTAAAMVPGGTAAGTYRVRLNCPDGKNASTTLNVVAAGQPSRGPATGFGGGAGDDQSGLLLAGGLATIALGVLLGLFAVRRRQAGVPGPVRGRAGS
jgi:hypothetical protein